MRRTFSILCLLSAPVLLPPAFSAAAESKAADTTLNQFDPAGLVRFNNLAQARDRREQLARFIWPEGRPAARPAVERGVTFPAALNGIDKKLVARIDRLDITISPFDFHAISYLITPATPSAKPRLALVHAGHVRDGATQYLSGGVRETINHLLQRGCVVAPLQMPVTGWNADADGALPDGARFQIKGRGTGGHNEMFEKLESQLKGQMFRFFLEPIVQAINEFAATHPDYQDVTMIGLSGGGWTTHLAAAIDPRIDLSIPVAGALPLYARPFSPGSEGDIEQFYAPLFREVDSDDPDDLPDRADGVASWLEVFALGGLADDPARPRRQIQLLNFHDSCCFSGDVHRTYDKFLSERVAKIGAGRWELVSDTTHRQHQISAFAIKNVLNPALDELAKPKRR